MDINAFLIDVTGEIDGFMYTYILLALLVATGIWYTIRTKAVQIRYIKDMFTQLTEKKHVRRRALHLVVPGAHGLHREPRRHGQHRRRGNRHRHGRPGRRVLDVAHGAWSAPRRPSSSPRSAQICKVSRHQDGEFRGGPAYYIQQASRQAAGSACCSAVLLILCFAFGFNGLQAFNACKRA